MKAADGAKMNTQMVPKEKEYRFRLKEHERFLILKALEDYRMGWIILYENVLKDPSKLEALRKAAPIPSKETANWMLDNTQRPILKFQRAARGICA